MNQYKRPAFRLKKSTQSAAVLNVDINKLKLTLNGSVIELSFDDYPLMSNLVAAINQIPDLSAEMYQGSDEVPVTNEQHVVSGNPPYQVMLNYAPKQGTLYISSFSEVSFQPGSPGQYRCDYSTGILTFYESDHGALFEASYIGQRPANLESLESKYLEIRNNKVKQIGLDFVDITYHLLPTTVPDVLSHIPGIPIENASGTSRILPEIIEDRIKNNLASLHNKLRIRLVETIIKCQSNPYSLNIQSGITCDETEPAYDGNDSNYLKLRVEPCIDIQRCELVYLGNLVRSYPFEWIQINKTRAELRIVPMTGAFHLMGMYSGSYLFHSFFPRSTTMFGHFLPWIQVDYLAGFKFGECPLDLKQALEQLVAIDILQIADGFMMPGITSKSIDGVSESYARSQQGTVFGGRIKEMQENVAKLIKPWTRTRFIVA